MLDLPEPRFAVTRVIVDHEVEAGVLSLSGLAGLAWPGTHLNRHRVRINTITHRLPFNRGLGHSRKLLSQNALCTVTPSARVTTLSQRRREATQRQWRT